MSAYGSLYRGVLMPVWETWIRHRPTLQHLRELERTQWCSLDELKSIQSSSLRRLLVHSYDNVPYYRARFDEAGLRPSDVSGPVDLGQLPLLTRQATRDAGELRGSTASPFPTIKKMTGGSTGQPLAFGYDAGSESWRNAVRLRGYGWAGCRPGDRTLHYWGRLPVHSRGYRWLKVAADRGLRREHVVDCGLRSDKTLEETARWIARARPTAIVSYCHAAVDLARYITEHRLKDWDSIPVLCCAEELLPSDRAVIAEAFGPAVFETYGCREFMLIGMECAAHEGLHLSAENLMVEVLVKDEGGKLRAAAPGETGEVVVTDLHNFGMPFIRYATGDVAIAADESRCGCGRAAPRLGAIGGRITDTLVRLDGSRVEGILFNVIFTGLAKAVRQFQVVQAKDRSITLRLVPDESFTEMDREAIRARCREYLGQLPVRIEEVRTIAERANGKRQVVVVEA
jgi:phenylacetate-CoA ligase